MKLMKAEKAWIIRVNATLAECPSERLGFFTTGERWISVYDRRKEQAIDAYQLRHNRDFCQGANDCGALAQERLTFPANVASTCG